MAVVKSLHINNYSKGKWTEFSNPMAQLLVNKKNKIPLYIPDPTQLSLKDTDRLKVNGWKKIFHASGNQKRIELFMSDKIDFKSKMVIRDKEGHYIMIKGSTQQEDITIVNMYAPNSTAPKYIKQTPTDLKGEKNNTVIAGDFNTPLLAMDQSPRQKNEQGNVGLEPYFRSMDLTHIYRTFHPTSAEYTFFSSMHRTSSRTGHVSHKTSLSKFKKTQIIPSIFSDQSV